MTDSILADVLKGAAVQVMRVIWDNTGQRVLNRRYREAPVQAQIAAEANARAFTERLAARIESSERRLRPGSKSASELVTSALSDPDVAITLAEGMAAASRTSDPGRHETLARLVAERLSAAPESEKAAAVRKAVAAVEVLSGHALNRLGLLALIQIVRPRYQATQADIPRPRAPISDEAAERYHALHDAQREQYCEWLRAQIAPYDPMPSSTTLGVQELMSAGCITIDPLVVSVGLPHDTPDEIRYSEGNQPSELSRLWEHLGQALLTPSGLVIGLAVHDARTGAENVAEWNWGPADDLPARYSMVKRLHELADDESLADRVAKVFSRRERQAALNRGDVTIRR